jgi:glycine hydroxymethyltransferase
MSVLKDYLASRSADQITPEMVSFTANLDLVNGAYPQIAKSIVKELTDQRSNLKLIASENFCSLPVQAAMGNLLTDKYAEGFAGQRFYAGCDNIDVIERLASEEACSLFGCDHAYVQPHSGADANLVAFWAILRQKIQVPMLVDSDGKMKNARLISKEEWDEIRAQLGNQRLLALDYYCGGHLTHGYRLNVSAQMFDVYSYKVNQETNLLDYDDIHQKLLEVKPLIFLVGFSAYSRNIDYSLLRKYADEVGAVFMVDMAHFAGLVAGGVLRGKYNPVEYADVVTTTTHKTLRGPRGGLVLCKNEFAEHVDKGCPYVIGGPLPHMLAAKAIALKEANSDKFKAYAQRIVDNSQQLAASLIEKGLYVLTSGTDNHIVLVDVSKLGLTGWQAEAALRSCHLTLNRNALPYEDQKGFSPLITSGLRFGTAATTTLGMGKEEMIEIADIISNVVLNLRPDENGNKKKDYILDESIRSDSISRVKKLLDKFVLYPEIDLAFLSTYFS